MTHEQMMEQAWRFIHEVGITNDAEKAATDKALYFVGDVHQVRDAYYRDLENGVNVEVEEDVQGFLARHGIQELTPPAYSKDDFEEMIRDWRADRAPEMDDLEIDEIIFDQGWIAYAHDSKCTYSLMDDGEGNIHITYLGGR